MDGGTVRDAGTTPVDAGTDAGTDPVDSGIDAGTDPVDSGTDAGTNPVDSGTDAGTDPVDSGTDAGTDPVDSGTDAGTEPVDAGTGPVDAGTDAGTDPADAGIDGGSEPTDAGADGGLDAGPPDNAVHIRRSLRYHTASGVTERPEDFERAPVELFIVDGDTFVSYPGEVAGPGEYVFPEVPRTTYYLKVGTAYIVTDTRDLDLSINFLGRPDAGISQPPPEGNDLVDLELEGLESWRAPSPPYGSTNPSTDLQLVSGELDFAGNVYASSPQEGDVSVHEAGALLTNSTGPMPVFDAALGDRAWLIQMSPRDLDPLPDGGVQRYSTAVRATHLGPISYDGTAPIPIQATLEALTLNEFPFDWRVSAFAALTAEVNPAATLRTSSFALNPAAHGPPEGWVGWSGELLSLYRPRGEASNVQAPLVYGNPFPSHWGLVGTASTSFGVPVTLPDGLNVLLTASISTTDRASALAAGPITPLIRPPRLLTLDGTAAYGPRELSVGPHLVSWQPPSSGTADLYQVRVRRFEYLDETFVVPVPVASFYVDGSATSLLLPADLFEPGTHYFLLVEAIRSEGYHVSDRPLTLIDRATYFRAAALTGLLSTPAQAR